jgi:hypothetical protein
MVNRLLLAAAGTFLVTAGTSNAALTSSFQFNGKGNWSIDAVGGNGTPVGDISAVVPLGSTIEKAFLYTSMISGATSGPLSVNFDSTVLTSADYTALGITAGLQAFRADVTAQVAAKVAGGSISPFTFSILAENSNPSIDGSVLAIIYSNPTESVRTIAFLDGFSATAGDTTAVNFATPLTAAQLADPAFQAQLSLGIGYSAGGGQYSTVAIDSPANLLTSSAGGYDDGVLANGGLITAGGLGDDPSNPADPTSNSSPDDELYTLTPYLSAGMAGFNVLTRNPSNDDNIFFAGLNITAVAGVNEPPPDVDPPDQGGGGNSNNVPDGGSTLSLFGIVAALGFSTRTGRRFLRL